MRLSSSASLRPSRELCEVMDGTVDWLLGGTEFRSKLEDLLAQFERLQLDHEEFTCLKFLALFNPAKHGKPLKTGLFFLIIDWPCAFPCGLHVFILI